MSNTLPNLGLGQTDKVWTAYQTCYPHPIMSMVVPPIGKTKEPEKVITVSKTYQSSEKLEKITRRAETCGCAVMMFWQGEKTTAEQKIHSGRIPYLRVKRTSLKAELMISHCLDQDACRGRLSCTEQKGRSCVRHSSSLFSRPFQRCGQSISQWRRLFRHLWVGDTL